MKQELYLGDCLIENEKIETASVDLILTDLPYGNMNTDGGRKFGINGWDFIIEPKQVYEIANRILRKNGKMILFSQEPYSTKLITEAIPNIPFSYRAIWEKDNFANGLGVNKNMVSFYEEVLIFSKSSGTVSLDTTWGVHPLKNYSEQVFDFIGLSKSKVYNRIGFGNFRFLRGCDKGNFTKPTQKVYHKMIDLFSIDKMDGYISYDEICKIDECFKKGNETARANYLEKHNEQYPSVFNLWEGNKYKSNILKYKKDYNGYHPTQKPVLLLEDLIKTFSNENNLVVDLTMGSGSTMVACKNTNRNFIGIEKEQKYFDIATKRIDQHNATPSLF